MVMRAIYEVKSSGFVIDAAWGWVENAKYDFMFPVRLWDEGEIVQEDAGALPPKTTGNTPAMEQSGVL